MIHPKKSLFKISIFYFYISCNLNVSNYTVFLRTFSSYDNLVETDKRGELRSSSPTLPSFATAPTVIEYTVLSLWR